MVCYIIMTLLGAGFVVYGIKKSKMILVAGALLAAAGLFLTVSTIILINGIKHQPPAPEIDYNALLGDWIFEQNDLPEGVDASADYFTEVAFVLVKEDRTYKTHWYYDDFDHTGTIQAEYEKLSDGTVVPVYIFYENGNTPWIRAYQVPDDPNTFKVGTENLERLVKNTGEG